MGDKCFPPILLTMKTFLSVLITGSILLLSPPIIAETNNVPPVSIIIIVLTNTNQLPELLYAITNQIPSVVIHNTNPKLIELKTQLRLMESRFNEVYSGVPNTFAGESNPINDKTLDQLIAIWKQKDIDISKISLVKEEIKKLQIGK